MDEGYEVTDGMVEEAERGIAWKEEGKQGGTRIGLVRARQIIRREKLSRDTVMRMYSFFSRHEKNKQAKGFESGEDGYPSAGRVAWALWGGDAGYTWSENIRNKIVKEEQERGYNMESITRTVNLSRGYYEDEDEMYEEKENNIWSFVVSTPEVDRYGTIIIPSGIDFTAYMNNPIVLAQHDATRFPVGRCLGLYMNGENLEATVQVECITEEGKALNALIEAGYVKAVSVGIIPVESEEQTINGNKVKVFTKSELVEFSIVSVPANRGALIKRTFSETLSQFIQRYKEETRMLTPEIEQKLKDELLPAVKEAVTTELTNLGFSMEEAQAAVEAMVAVGSEALIASLRGDVAMPEDQVAEQPVAEPPVEVVSEYDDSENPDETSASYEASLDIDYDDEGDYATSYTAEELRIGKKLAAKTEAQIEEGLKMIKRGYRMIAVVRGKVHKNKGGSSLNPKNKKDYVPDPVPFSYKAPVQNSHRIALEMPVQKTTEELLKLI